MSNYRYLMVRVPEGDDLDEILGELRAEPGFLVEAIHPELLGHVRRVRRAFEQADYETGDEIRSDVAHDLYDYFTGMVKD